MLIEFRISNYRSIAEEQILSLVPATKQREYLEHLINDGKYQALNTIAMYGANASGKSNLLLSMSLLDKIVHLSARASSTTPLPYDPFLLKAGWADKPTTFEITFIIKGVRYRFGFSYNRTYILTEWLYRKAQGREVSLYEREGDIIEVSSGLKGNKKLIEAAIEATRDNALFLSTCDMLNVKEAKLIFQWFEHFYMIDGLHTEEIRTVNMWEKGQYREEIKAYLARLNLGFLDLDVQIKDFEANDFPQHITAKERQVLLSALQGAKSYAVSTTHRQYDEQGQPTSNQLKWAFEERESAGTKKVFHLSGPVVWALNKGGVLIIDEIEAKMHSNLTREIIQMFLNPATNPKQTQLIFATHDTNLLSQTQLRRDQIYFIEKNSWQATELFSLSDFIYLHKNGSKERPDVNKEKRYLEGRYGATPVFEPLELNALLYG